MASEIIVRDLYNGLYHMVHNPNARGRAPRYKVNDVLKPTGVTTILGQTLAKDLMDWAVSCAIDYLKERVPVVTVADLEVAAKEYTRKRDSGAGTGTEAHALVETFLKGNKPDKTGTYSVEAINAYNAFVKWFAETQPEVLNVEEVVYSQKYEYAGTYDCMLRIDGKNYLCDLKTTNASRKAPKGVYAENFTQLGAYAGAHEEQRQWEEENGGSTLVKIDDLMVISAKKNGAMDIITASDLELTVEECTDRFNDIVGIFKFMKQTTAKLGGK